MTLPTEIRERAWYFQPSFTLLIALALTLVIYPFADQTKALRAVAHLVDVCMVLMVVRLLRQPNMLRSGWVIGIPTIGFQLAYLAWPGGWVEVVMLIMQIVFHSYAVVALLEYVLRDDHITLDELFAIMAIYVLMALAWASAYALVVYFDPNAIFINSTNNLKTYVSFADLVYYSMVTLTSTGYGEITPVSPAARALAMLQQWASIMYVAILVARVTTLYRHR
jgi:hypothetical protein